MFVLFSFITINLLRDTFIFKGSVRVRNTRNLILIMFSFITITLFIAMNIFHVGMLCKRELNFMFVMFGFNPMNSLLYKIKY